MKTFSPKLYFTSMAIFGFTVLPCQVVLADDWGCQVALCASNPAGPMAVAECVPVMERLYNQLAHHGSWPSCDRSSAPQQSAAESFSNASTGNVNAQNQPPSAGPSTGQ